MEYQRRFLRCWASRKALTANYSVVVALLVEPRCAGGAFNV